MTLNRLTAYIGGLMLVATLSAFAQELSKDQWQNEINAATNRRNELKATADKLDLDITNLKSQLSKVDADLTACEDELYKMLGLTRDQVEAFDNELKKYEQRTDEMMRMSDADLMNSRDELMTMSKRVDQMFKEKIAKLGRFASRLADLRKKIDALMSTLAKAGMASVYTVGTWAKDRDCLWNIAKKPTIYNNAWLWPKIWQGNKDKVRDPDLIKPGWKLNIPTGNELSKEEKAAASSYYRQKAGQ